MTGWRYAAVLASAACATEDLRTPPRIVPVDLAIEIGRATGDPAVSARSAEGTPFALQTWLRVEVRGRWDVATPEPDARCAALWRWPDGGVAPAGDARVQAWGRGLGAAAVYVFRPEDAVEATTDCALVHDVPPGNLLGGGVAVAWVTSPWAPWSEAVGDLPPAIVPTGVERWPWLPDAHVVGAWFGILGDDGALVGTRRGVAVALALDDAGRVQVNGGGLLRGLAADAVLARPDGEPALWRAGTVDRFVLAWPSAPLPQLAPTAAR